MHQFNGKNGCPSCLHPGEWKHGSCYYLPHTKYVSRSNDSVKMAANEAEKNRVIVDGIKGRSALTVVIYLVGGAPVDYMHCVLEDHCLFLQFLYSSYTFKCVKISFPDSNYCYIVSIPNNFEHHP